MPVFKGFKWEKNSCAYDALITSLWIIFSCGRDETRDRINSCLPLMGSKFSGMMDKSLTFLEANNQIRDYYFIPTIKNDFSRGVYQGMGDLTNHIMTQSLITIDDDIFDSFMFEYKYHKKCLNSLCSQFSKQLISVCHCRCLNFNGESCAVIGVGNMILEHFSRENKNHRCLECEGPMDNINVIVYSPHIICVNFVGNIVESDIDKVIVCNLETYDLVSVIYLMPQHFRTRLNINNKAYEYDGMINHGVFREIQHDNPFPGSIANNAGEVFMRVISVYYVKR